MRGHTTAFENFGYLTIFCSGYGAPVACGNARNDVTQKELFLDHMATFVKSPKKVEKVRSVEFLVVLVDKHPSWKDNFKYNKISVTQSNPTELLDKHSLFAIQYSVDTYVNYTTVPGISNFGLDQSSSKILETTITEENLKDIELFFLHIDTHP